MTKIFPSLLSADFMNLEQEVQHLTNAGVDGLHFDVMDGQFVPNISIGFPVLEALRQKTKLPIDVHLMIENPEQYIDAFCEKGADKVSVHIEATPHIHRAIQKIKTHGKEAGVVLNPGTSWHQIEAILSEVDFVLVMSVNPGFGGQTFIPQSIEKIQALHTYRQKHQLNYKIEVDGGINHQTAAKVIEAGADWLVAGSYFFKFDSYQEALRHLKSEG
ncbi:MULTISPECIES: ribulose-phosphate 3-epimerase [Staphylococcus]|uniref:Ribulose-phosphate 3-epimerase n=1 Tax=Staphylococcus chromogenes TaxID=46126 RepID=A0AAE5T1U7_STACR|nr:MULTISPECIES: ribulose-phosphate 3-epimerase [Staphylococcus]KDP13209.1 ribulose-phosphate 3-epimerase [Staphylococcus chromogenes MU 970]MBP0045093.1 ribulose-phosphate 3-epimerase [Staphylococcus chromogenes]MBV5136767.1 ribulose-phosphate 3-epimerase [Staphylococcus chromogenes]MBV5190220.1 ribulose-phosphate 3-epimerase [Staphylococcus chromogenes]MBW3131323.1 ribulose-phosphate 3-epimerase [Staphylococcus chromogenes]